MLQIFQDNRRIMTAEAERVGHRNVTSASRATFGT